MTFLRKYTGLFFLFNWDGENVSEYSVLRNYLRKYMQKGKNNAKLKKVPSKFSPGLGENNCKIISTWNFGNIFEQEKGRAFPVKSRFILIEILLFILSSACATIHALSPTQNPIIFPTKTTKPTILPIETVLPTPTSIMSVYWESNFVENLDEVNLDVDRSVGCEEFQVYSSDLSIKQVIDNNAPSGNQSVLELTANANHRAGLFTNAIGNIDIEFIDNSRYVYEGYFRKVEGTNPEMINLNLDLVEDFEERYAEIIWGLNRYTPLYSWIYTRGPDFKEIKLFQIPVDTNWHYFKLVTEYRSNPKSRKIISITVDDQTEIINMEMGRSKKSWPFAFKIFFETHNMYTNCSSSNNFIGTSRWDSLLVYSEPIND